MDNIDLTLLAWSLECTEHLLHLEARLAKSAHAINNALAVILLEAESSPNPIIREKINIIKEILSSLRK